MTNNRDLAVPAEVESDANALEVLRGWVANRGLVCAVHPTIWKDPAAWGIVLADAARHIAQTMANEFGNDSDRALARIQDRFNQELSTPIAPASP